MAMSLDQAQQLVQSSGGRAYATGGTADAGPPADTGGTGTLDPQIIERYINGTATQQDIQQLVAAGMITATEAQTYYAKTQNAANGTSTDPFAGLYAYDPQTGYTSTQPADSEIGDSHFPGTVSTYIDPKTGILYDANGKPLPEYQQKALGGGIGGTDPAQIGYDYANLAENQRQFDKTYGLQQQQFGLSQEQQREAEVGNRASSGLTLADLARNMANDAYTRASDPGNFPAYLASMAGMPQGTGSPISSLLGQGVQIQSPGQANPLSDPRFQSLLNQLYGYAQPQNLQTVQNIAGANGGQLPQSFYDYTHTQNPNGPPAASSTPAYAGGGTQMLNEPVIGIGLHSGQPKFLAGEAGQEKLTFEPVHNHSNGGMPVPHQHAMGDQDHEHLASGEMKSDMRKYADGGQAQTGVDGAYGGQGSTQFTPHQLIAAYNAYHPNAQMADTTFTPAEASAISLGKALQPLGYAPRPVMDELLSGRAPMPGALNEQFMNRLPTSLKLLLGSTVQSFLGSNGLQDFNDELTRYAMPGQSSYTQNAYQ